jgi:hypothetical protein
MSNRADELAADEQGQNMSHIIIFNQKQQYKIQDGGEILLD